MKAIRALCIVLIAFGVVCSTLSFINFVTKLDASADRIALHFGVFAQWLMVLALGIIAWLMGRSANGRK